MHSTAMDGSAKSQLLLSAVAIALQPPTIGEDYRIRRDSSPGGLLSMKWLFSSSWLVLSVLALLPARENPKPIALTSDRGLDAWKGPTGDWFLTESVLLDSDNPKRLKGTSGKGGILVNGASGRSPDLVSKEKFGDIELHLEFLIAKGSNSGVKFHAHYEIQIYDSHGVKTPTASDCGGIYPRAELKPTYHYLDKGIPPRVNAAKPAGEWQTLDAIFLAPRFDDDNKKTANARILKATLNDQVIHENIELQTPTGHAWRNKEMAAGPLLLQGDHGPVAFRNVVVKPYRGEKKESK
jgi:Domain of Unknown Function (DUF1080)